MDAAEDERCWSIRRWPVYPLFIPERAFVMPTRLARLPPKGVCGRLLELFSGALWRRSLPKISWARFSALRF